MLHMWRSGHGDTVSIRIMDITKDTMWQIKRMFIKLCREMSFCERYNVCHSSVYYEGWGLDLSQETGGECHRFPHCFPAGAAPLSHLRGVTRHPLLYASEKFL